MEQAWKERARPPCMERRYEFANYVELRDFLDRAAELSEHEGFYPDMGFGRDYVNVTIHAQEGAAGIDAAQRRFAERLDELRGAGKAA
jgi:4a-hydroxytetrahydrobiopterin dehydratase